METKKNKIYKGESWNCAYCKHLLGRFIFNDKVLITGPKGQEYEMGFTDVEVNCPSCGKRNRLISHQLRNIRSYLADLQKHESEEVREFAEELASRIEMMVPLGKLGFKNLYFLDDRRSKILKSKLSELQRRIYDRLRALEGASDDERLRSGVVKMIADELQLPRTKIEKDIVKIDEEISKIRTALDKGF
jgi:hypothetical protein